MPEANAIPPDKLVRVYIKMRTYRDDLVKKSEADIAKVEDSMARIKSALLQYCNDQQVTSSKTPSGSFYRSLKKRYWTNDWESMGKFIVDNNVPELLEKRLHQGNTQEFLEMNPNLLPPGLNVDSEYTITVRKPT